MTNTFNVEAFRAELVTCMSKVNEEACRRVAGDPSNASWSYTIRDAATVNTLEVVIKALDAATQRNTEG